MKRLIKNSGQGSLKAVSSIFVWIALFCVGGLTSCDYEDELNTPEGKIQYFVSQYYPSTAIENKSTLPSGEIQVVLKNSATILFDQNGSWLSVDGNGTVLPAVLLYDQLPENLYRYIEEMEATDGVYRISRNSSNYTVGFLDSSVEYDIASGKISYITDGGTV